jgi:drug/metabolite transporter (DMT)-like permease
VSRRGWVAFAVASVMWGIPYFFIKVAVDAGVAPPFVAWARVVIGAAILLPIAWRMGALRGLRSRLGWLLAFAVVEVGLPFPLIAGGEQFVSSSLAAILIATVPMIIALMALRFDHAERASGWRLVGLFIGLGGVVALLGIDVAGRPQELLGAGMILLAAVGYATAGMLAKHRLSDLGPVGPAAAGLGLGALVLAPAGLLTAPTAMPDATAVGSLLVLGVFSTAIAFLAFFTLIAEAGPGRASVITYVNPAVAVLLGVLILHEQLGPGSFVGLAMILVGSWLSTGGRVPGVRRMAQQPSA